MPIAALLKRQETPSGSTPERQLAPIAAAFLKALNQGASKTAPDGQVIHVSSVVSEAAALYERLRYSLDYHEEHLLRRHALERILRRRFDEKPSFEGVAKGLMIELIQAQYLKNDQVLETVVSDVQVILDRYAAALDLLLPRSGSERRAIRDWLLGLLSAELDGELVPAPEERALVELMAHYVARDNPLEGWSVPEAERQTQVFIACYRALFAFDPQTLRYLLLSRRFPAWKVARATDVPEMVTELRALRQEVEQALRHPLAAKLYRAFRTRAIAFHALKDIVLKKPDAAIDVLSDEERLTGVLREVCEVYYAQARRRLYRSALRATVYIFLTKVILAVSVEAPLEKAIYGQAAPLPLLINIAFPPVLMMLLTITTRLPGAANTAAIRRLISVLLYGESRRIFAPLRPPTGQGAAAVSRSFFTLFYIVIFTITFGLILTGLRQLEYTAVSAGLFIFFLCVVSFFALRVRQPVRDLFVTRHRENLVVFLLDFFSLPILNIGHWISVTSARFNVFLYLFDYFLEAPFKAFLLMVEDVLGSFRERREDLF